MTTPTIKRRRPRMVTGWAFIDPHYNTARPRHIRFYETRNRARAEYAYAKKCFGAYGGIWKQSIPAPKGKK